MAENPVEFNDICSSFELKKTVFTGSDNITMSFCTLLDNTDQTTVESIRHRLENTGRAAFVEIKEHMSKMTLSKEIINDFFEESLLAVFSTVQEVLDGVVGVKQIVVAGGLCGSLYVQKRLKMRFGNMVSFLHHPQSATLKGAILHYNKTRA